MAYEKSDIKLLANKVRDFLQKQDSAWKAPYLENAEKVITLLGGQLTVNNEWKPEWGDGIIQRLPSDNKYNFKIAVPHNTSLNRDTFTIAHELGHLFLHLYYGRKAAWEASQEYFQDAILTRNGSGTMEQEANYFAACFLMPEEEFEKVYNSKKNIKDVATHFGVSEQAATIRRKSLDLPNLEKVNG